MGARTATAPSCCLKLLCGSTVFVVEQQAMVQLFTNLLTYYIHLQTDVLREIFQANIKIDARLLI